MHAVAEEEEEGWRKQGWEGEAHAPATWRAEAAAADYP